MNPTEPDPIVIDTNVFVGAAFHPGSRSATVIRAVRDGLRRMPWTDATRREIEHVLGKIPPLSVDAFRDLFVDGERRTEIDDREGLDWVTDPEDRKFAALARATGAILVSNDEHLLGRRGEASITVLTPSEFVAGLRESGRSGSEQP